jgi:uncharacterized protein YdeI (YjbR/CyaY-like superfamily)
LANLSPVDVRFFETPSELRSWLETHHDTATQLWVGFYKKSSGKPSISYPEALDQALCYGWIDGVRKSLDSVSYTTRFTPRRSRSVWSQVNIRRVAELSSLGLMHPAGLKAFERLDPELTNRYSSERANVTLSPAYENSFRANKKAWDFFQAQPPSYRRPAMWWVMSAKRDDTRLRRLNTLIRDSEDGRRLPLLTSKPKQ